MAKKAPLSEVVRLALRRERAARGLTQEQLCQQARVSIDAVTRIEGGSRSPNLATLEALAAALAINPAQLLDVEPAARPASAPLRRIEAMLASEPRVVQEAAEGVVRSLLKAVRATGIEQRAKPTRTKRRV